MSTFTKPSAVVALTLAKDTDINDLADAVEVAFAVIPDEARLERGTTNYVVSGGAANVYTVSMPKTLGAYVDGYEVVFKANHTNTGAATIDIDGLGAKSLRRQYGEALAAGDIQADKIVPFRYNSTSGYFEMQLIATGNMTDVTTVAGISGNVTTVAGISADVTTVAGIHADVTTVAGIHANVTTVSGVAANVTTVAGNTANINTVAGVSANVTTVAGIHADVTTVAGISADVSTVAGDTIPIGIIAADLVGVDTIGTVAGIAANVTTVSGISADVTTVAGISANVTTVAGIHANVTTVAGISANVTTVAGDSASIGTIATDLTGANTIGVVAGNIADIQTVAGISANVTTVAGDTANIGTIATDLNGADTIGTVSADLSGANTIGAVATIAANVTTVAGDTANIGTIATDLNGADTIGTVAGIAANVTTVAGISANVTTVAGIDTDVIAVAAIATEIQAANYFSRKNHIINGNFDVWQRGTSFAASSYGADRWFTAVSGSTFVGTQQNFTLGQTDVPNNPEYFCRTVVTTGGGATSFIMQTHRIEFVKTLSGMTATLSFYAKADAVKNMTVEFNQYFGTGGSPSATVTTIGVTKIALTTSWTKFTVTVAIPSISGKTLGTDLNDYLAVNFWLDAGSDFDARTDSLGNQSGTFDIAQVQLEQGSVATLFEPRTYGEELALCQRYYWQGKALGSGTGSYWAGAVGLHIGAIGSFPVEMRTSPTMGIVTDATYSNCTHLAVQASPTGFTHRVTSTLVATIRALGGIYSASAEL